MVSGLYRDVNQDDIRCVFVNQASDRVLGRDIVFSPIDIVYDVVGVANNEHIAAGDKYTRITERLAQEIPIIGGFLGGGRIPIASVVADGKKSSKSYRIFTE